MHAIGMIVDKYPRANPKMMLGAGPILQDSAKFWTNRYLFDVKISVTHPMINPAHNPTTTHP